MQSEYPSFSYDNETLTLIPGSHFTKYELKSRLRQMGHDVDNIEGKKELVNLYESSIKNEESRLRIIQQLIKDTENKNNKLGKSQRQSLPNNFFDSNNKMMNIAYDAKPFKTKEQQITLIKPIHTNKGEFKNNPFISAKSRLTQGNYHNNFGNSSNLLINSFNISNNSVNSEYNNINNNTIQNQNDNNNIIDNRPKKQIEEINTDIYDVKDNNKFNPNYQGNINPKNNQESIEMIIQQNETLENPQEEKLKSKNNNISVRENNKNDDSFNRKNKYESNEEIYYNKAKEPDEVSNFSFLSAFSQFKKNPIYKNKKFICFHILVLLLILSVAIGSLNLINNNYETISGFISGILNAVSERLFNRHMIIPIIVLIILIIVLMNLLDKYNFKKRCEKIMENILKDLTNQRENRVISEDDIYKKYVQNYGVNYEEFIQKYIPVLRKMRRKVNHLRISSIENDEGKTILFWELNNNDNI